MKFITNNHLFLAVIALILAINNFSSVLAVKIRGQNSLLDDDDNSSGGSGAMTEGQQWAAVFAADSKDVQNVGDICGTGEFGYC